MKVHDEARAQAPQRASRAPIPVTVAQLSDFDEVIDVRSEGEYGEDHIPGALNCPVLDDSHVWKELRRFDARRPVFVEAESRKIGRLRVPEALIDAMWASDCLVLEAPLAVRVELLKSEYAHYLSEPELLALQLDCLAALHGKETIGRWQSLARDGRWDPLVEELLVRHYDPAYTRSTLKHYPALERAPRRTLQEATDAAFRRLANEVIDGIEERVAQ